MQQPLLYIALIPPQVDTFRDPEAVAIGQQDHGVVAVPIRSHTARCPAQAFDFGCGQVCAGADLGMFAALWKRALQHDILVSDKDACF
jgi:hypothetical protein